MEQLAGGYVWMINDTISDRPSDMVISSNEEGNLLTEEQQWDKIRFIKEIAEKVWGRK